jgi:preprotein translocase subunit SecG
MNMILTLILAVQMLTALSMIGLILIQHGKGADMGAAFGSGGSGSLFGASGSANFMSRTTAVLAAVFFVCTLALAYFGNLRPVESGSVLDGAPVTAPAAPVAPGAGQIPGNTAPAAPPAGSGAGGAAVPPAAPASGAGQIPTR